MEAIAGVPALFKILILFGCIMGLYRARAPLYAALLAVSLGAGLWFGAGAWDTLRIMARSAVAQETLFLYAVVALILGYSNMLDKTGILNGIVESFSRLFGRSMVSGAALPALIGLLPMPGGAIFSAPMVQAACGPGGGQTPEQKAAVNYWFRHIWEYWWPLYPGIIVASSLFRVSAWKLAALHLPLTAVAVAAGYFIILRPSFPADGQPSPSGNGLRNGNLSSALNRSSSIIVTIVVIFGAGAALERSGLTPTAAKYWPVILGIALGIAWVAVRHRLGAVRTARLLAVRGMGSMVLLAMGVMVFRDTLVAVNAFAGVQTDLEAYRVPVVVVIAALPFVSGMVLGLAVGFVGASFPLVISLLPDSVAGSDTRLAYLTLAYTFGYMGMMLSPVHLCLVLTKDFFKAEFAGIYKFLVPIAIIIMISGTGCFLVYRALFS
jgi:integral membrane protein (TIGR00529 family)